jgi:putative two-component system response regulator
MNELPFKNKQANILIVDDTLSNLDILSEILKQKGYNIRPVTSGKQALETSLISPPDIILLDINMPVMNGYEVCERLKSDKRLNKIPVIFISALNETLDKVKAFAVGCVDYITKPFQYEEVLARVDSHVKIYKLQTKMEELVDEKIKEIFDSQMATIFALAKIAESRDEDTGMHLDRVQSYCRLLSFKLMDIPGFKTQIDLSFVENVFHSSPLHDIGKVAIPDAILLKPGKLTPEEFEIMKTHAAIGAHYLKTIYENYPNNSFIKMGIKIAMNHHEKWDGSGYPHGLTGEDIPISARIMALADVYDALRSKRPYKNPVGHRESVDIIVKGRGVHFDPTIIDTFIKIQNDFEKIADESIFIKANELAHPRNSHFERYT